MSLARKILSNTAWQVIGRVVTSLLGIISIKFITNYLSTTGYGEYTAIYDFVAIFAILADFGLFTIAVREMAGNEKYIEKILGNVLSLRTVLGIVSLGFAALVALTIPAYQNTHIPFGIAIVAAATVLMMMSSAISAVLQLHLKMQWFSIATLAGKIVSVIYIVATILVWFPNDPSAGFPHLLYGWVYGNILTILITYLPARRLAKVRFSFDFTLWKEILGKSLPYGLALLLGMLYFRTGSVLMSFFGMRHEVGIYGVPMKILEIANLIPVFFMNSVLPILTRSLKDNLERAKLLIQYAFEFMGLAAFPMLLGGIVLAKPLIAGVSSDAFLSGAAGPGTLGADSVLNILLLAMTVYFFHIAFGFTLIALGRQKKLLVINAVAAVFNITVNLLVIPKFSFVGVAVTAVATESIILVSNFSMVRSLAAFRPNFLFLGKAFFSAFVMAAAIFFADPVLRGIFALKSLLILIPLGAAIYLGMLILTRAFTPQMLAFLRKPKQGAEEGPGTLP